jgi:flagellar biosynthesis component FlhA
MNNLTRKQKILFVAAGVCLLIGLITTWRLWYIGTLILGIIGLIDTGIFKGDSKQMTDGNQPVEEAINEDDMKECPFCAEKIRKNAKLCRFCGKEIESTKKKKNENIL